MNPGSLLVPNPKYGTLVRLYCDPLFESWDRHLNQREVVTCIREYNNTYDQGVLEVLSSDGIRWVFASDLVHLNEVER